MSVLYELPSPVYEIRQGESLAIDIPVTDNVGRPVDISGGDVTQIIVTLVYTKNTVGSPIFSKYALNSLGIGWGGIVVTGNIISVLAEREDTLQWNDGFAKAVVTIESTDPILTNKVRDFEVKNLIKIVKSENKEFTLS